MLVLRLNFGLLTCIYLFSKSSGGKILVKMFDYGIFNKITTLSFSSFSKSSMSDFNHPAIKRFLESPSRSSSPLNQGSEAHSIGHSETESLSQPTEPGERDSQGWKEDELRQLERRPGRNTGKVRLLR